MAITSALPNSFKAELLGGEHDFAAGGAVAAGFVKQFMNDDPTTYLSNEEQQKNL